ncbi:kinase-like domain-containing protein [Rhizoctonia solani]|nr:kinase-like domain-containing protein [Rhizoctonia solani]
MSHHSTIMTGSELVTLLSSPGIPVVTNRLTQLADVTLEAPHGISGILCHAKYGGAEVAARVIRLYVAPNNANYQILKGAADELKVWLRLNHENIVPLLGLACIQGQLTLVTPWAHKGRIIPFLRNHRPVNTLKMCAQLASAVAYLHSKGVVHQNIQAKNVLLSESDDVKLVGLGAWTMKRIGHHGDGINESELRLRWTAPEVFTSTSGYTTETDVWALGMTILEIFTKLHPFATVKSAQDAVSKAINREIPSRPADFTGYDQLWGLLVQCWLYDPRRRPSAAAVYDAVSPEDDLRGNSNCEIGPINCPQILGDELFESDANGSYVIPLRRK